ncbi:hypothetical protein D3C87_1822130 [compost metagenome]
MHIWLFRSADVDRILAYPTLFFYGLGCGFVLPSLMSMALKSIPAELAGAASGMYATFQQTAIAFGIGIIGGLFFFIAGKQPSYETYLKAYQTTMSVNILLLVMVGVFLILLPDNRVPD